MKINHDLSSFNQNRPHKNSERSVDELFTVFFIFGISVMGLSALLLDPSFETRSRFKKLAEEHTAFDACTASSTLAEGFERLHRGMECDAIYISTRFDPVIVSRFIGKSRGAAGFRDAANLVMVSRDSRNTSMKQFEMGNPDGYLLEPLVTKDLDGSVKFLQEFKERKVKVQEAALAPVNYKALCARMAVAIDKGKPGMKDLKAISSRLDSFTPEQLEQFFDVLTEYFGSIDKPLAALSARRKA